MSYVRLQKLRAVDDPVAPPGDPSTYPYGQLPDKIESLPVAYWFEGWLVYPPIVGKRVAVLRLIRNGLRCPGVFWSTQVTSVEPGYFCTKNSVYKIAEVTPFADDDLDFWVRLTSHQPVPMTAEQAQSLDDENRGNR
jgi:hypothetical protein